MNMYSTGNAFSYAFKSSSASSHSAVGGFRLLMLVTASLKGS